MKNLLVYINPNKSFLGDSDVLAKVQIDNSIELGWDKKDILFVTNFPFSYRGVSAYVIDGGTFCSFRPLSTKTLTVNYLLQNNLLEDDLHWVHDLDCYQNEPLGEVEINDVGLTDYGWSEKWCLGSYFFKLGSASLFEAIKKEIFDIHNEDERALVNLTKRNQDNINERITKLNITYQIGMRHVNDNCKKADKPLKVLHFHPFKRGLLDIFMYGNNCMEKPLMSAGLTRSFIKHGIR